MDLRNYNSAAERRKAIENELKIIIPHIGTYSFDEDTAAKKHCENMIGSIQVPIGVAGPLRIKNQVFDPEAQTRRESRIKDFYIPLATTEGALVASVNRGCKAITESGGVAVISKRVGITRAPVFVVKNIIEGKQFIEWLESNLAEVKEITESTSAHITLLEIKPWLVGKNVFLRFRFDTQDAMGMNMATIATAKAAEFIEQKTSAKLVALSGNMCVDKKANALNFIDGRGISVWAEATIPENIVAAVLKTTIQEVVEVAERKLHVGSIMSHSLGSNAQIANVLAAIFLATGQDLAHIAECSTGVTTVEMADNDSLSICVYIPDLVIGSVGGGTELVTQKEALSILEIVGGNNGENAVKFAEVIGATVLAGELSLLASLAEGSLAKAHERLGRGK